MINITGINLAEFAKKVYELSVPLGLGQLHYTEEPLSDADANECVELSAKDDHIALNMDYVHGRSCKMIVFRNEDALEIRSPWYDHTNTQLKELLDAFDIEDKSSGEHGCACACKDCA